MIFLDTIGSLLIEIKRNME